MTKQLVNQMQWMVKPLKQHLQQMQKIRRWAAQNGTESSCFHFTQILLTLTSKHLRFKIVNTFFPTGVRRSGCISAHNPSLFLIDLLYLSFIWTLHSIGLKLSTQLWNYKNIIIIMLINFSFYHESFYFVFVFYLFNKR